MKELFKNPQYIRLWLAQVISELGDGITKTVIIVLVSTLTGDPFMIGMVLFAALLPSAVFSSLLAPFTDRFPKRTMMISSDLYRMVIVLFMIVFSDNAWMLLLLVVLEGIGTAVFEPARAASIPFLVGKKNLSSAMAFSQGTSQALYIIGPSVAGLLLFLGNVNIIFIINAITYILSACFLFTISKLAVKGEVAEGESFFSSLIDGYRTVGILPALRFLILLLIPVTITAGILSTNNSAMFLQYFNVKAEQFGFLQSVVGVGAVIGALVSPLLLKKMKAGVMLLLATGLIGIIMVLVWPLAMLYDYTGSIVLFCWAVIVGTLNAMLNVPLSSLFLAITPEKYLGRAAGIYQSTIAVGMMIGILAGGYFARLTDSIFTTGIAGIVMIALALFFPLLKGFKYLTADQIQQPEQEEQQPSVAAT
ncbi:MFS transporter [Longirhabdus pacifica]|uniref:MFS transporter n=1 Tax=Longirhabdus pacifica TaxID=2305227 RepID=UPI001008C6CC|nr:MFS transporter [Longirhabdus pacifica]